MSNKLIGIVIIALILVLAPIISNKPMSFASTNSPSKLNILIGPSSVLADNNAYDCIFVQLQDSSGQPSRALQDTTITLSSSLTNVGTISPSITITEGTTYAIASFYSTFTPGTTTISASATGYSTEQSSITTIGPIPSTIAVYGFPSTLPSDGGSYNAIMIQLQDTSGAPARAPQGGVQVALSCSYTSVGTVDPAVIIPEGQTYATANFDTTTKAQTQATPQMAIITAVAQGYTSKQVTITTTPTATNPNQLKIFVGPPQVLADQNAYKQIAIALLNNAGYVGYAQSDQIINVASSDQSVGKITSQITIPKSQAYVLATLNSTYKAGITTITAVGTNLLADHQSISTFGFTPTKLAVYCVPATLPSDGSTYQAIQVQLQDPQGRPAKDPQGDVMVNLFSSQPTIGGVSATLTIPFGKTQAAGTFTVTNAPGTTTITAQSSGYITGQTQITTYLIDFSPLQITLTTNPQNVSNGNNADITAYVTAYGTPIIGATVTFTSNNGTFTSTADQGNGYYKTTFTAPNFSTNTNSTITASALKTGYLNTQNTTQLIVAPGANSTTTTTAGVMQFCLEDELGNSLTDTLVSSITQPTGTPTLIEVTNATGYVTFQIAVAGSYTFKIVKNGFIPQNETIEYDGRPLPPLTITLTSSNPNDPGNNLFIIVSIIVVAVAFGVIGSLYLIRQKKSPNVTKLKEVQKQMKSKFES